VIVLGKGDEGSGEEGRVGWMLKYLGVQNVQIMSFKNFSGKKGSGSWEGSDSAPIWLVKPVEKLRIRKDELKTNGNNYFVLDVRSPSEFKGESGSSAKRRGHIPGAKNIEWTQFVDSKGDPKNPEEVKTLLKQQGVDLSKPVVTYCMGGVRAGYVAYTLSQAGVDVRNYDGSFWEWSADPTLPVER
jgi:thiosulfate/3-mercaptopyruvate sulfurtransferase